MKNFTTFIEKYRQGKISRREFLKDIGVYIVKFPHFMGFHDDDIRHEFYAYFASKLDRVIAKYDAVQNISFFKWFNKVLRNQFISFIKSFNSNRILEEQFETCFLEEQHASPEETTDEIPDLDLSKLTDKEKKMVFLKFGFDEGRSLIKNATAKKIEKKKDLEKRLEWKYYRLLKLQKAIKHEIDPVIKKDIIRKETAMRKSKRKIEMRLKSLSLNPSINLIARESGINKSTASTYFKRAKNKIQKSGLENIMIQ